MAGRIPEAYVEQVLARTDIVELIGARVSLRRSGHDYAARCPFHEERTPSFTVSPAKQFYHCFGCGAHGSAIGFLMAHDSLSFPEAVAELANRAGLPPPASEPGAGTPVEPDIYPVLAAADRFFRSQLRRHPAAERAREYLKGRGLTGQVAAGFGLGYAPPDRDALARALEARFPGALAVRAGLVVAEEQGRRDKFRDRVMFPIEDHRGRVVGFGGRALGEAKPKYMNSPETPVFHKGSLLYGLHRVQQLKPAPEALLVVEGYLDVIALAQFGIPNVVATLGTAATPEQLRRAFRVCPELVFCFDGDAAGRRAAEKALETVLGELHDGRQVRFLFLPEGEDPDSLVRGQGPDALRALILGATPLAEQLFTLLTARANPATLEGRARLVELARPLLGRLPAGIYRQLVEQRLAQLAGVTGEQLAAHLKPAPPSRPRATPPAARPAARKPSLVRRLVSLLAHDPALAAEVSDTGALAGLPAPGTAFLARLCETLAAAPDLTLGTLVERWRGTADGELLARALAREAPPLDAAAARLEFRDCLARLKSDAAGPMLQAVLRGRRPADLDASAARRWLDQLATDKRKP